MNHECTLRLQLAAGSPFTCGIFHTTNSYWNGTDFELSYAVPISVLCVS